MRRRVSVILLGIIVSTSQFGWVKSFAQATDKLDLAIEALKSNHPPNRDVAIHDLHDSVFQDVNLTQFQFGLQHSSALIRRFRDRSLEVLNPLVSSAKTGDRSTRLTAMWLLSILGPNAYGARAELAKIVNDKSEDLESRATALSALFYVTPESESVLSRAVFPIDMLNLPDKNDPMNSLFPHTFLVLVPVVEGTLLASGHMRSEVPFLISLCKSDDPRIRGLALFFLSRFGTEARDCLPQLHDLLREVGDDIHFAVSVVIAHTDPGENVIAMLRSRLSVTDQARFDTELLEFQTEINRYVGVLETIIANKDVTTLRFAELHIAWLRLGTGPVRRRTMWLLSKVKNLPENLRLELRKAQQKEGLGIPSEPTHPSVDSQSNQCPNLSYNCRRYQYRGGYEYLQDPIRQPVARCWFLRARAVRPVLSR